MRLRRLNLNRYGMFDDYSLDFGRPKSCAPDFHIVFGPNEAGKTTMFNGLLDCFFGIHSRSPYAFRHGSSIRVGATLEIDGEELGFVRIRKRNDSLLDDAGNPIDEELLSTALSRLSREAWTTMFSLDEVTLAAGAEDLLAGKGELGPVIFQSSAGLPDLNRTLDGIMKRSEELFVPASPGRQRKTELRELAAKVGEIEKDLKEIDTNERVYKELRDNLQTAQSLEDDARSKHESLNAKLNQLENLKIALPDVEELMKNREIARELERYPEAPPGSVEEAKELLVRYKKVESGKLGAKERSERLERERARISIDPDILRYRERVNELSQSAAVTARMRDELPRREENRSEIREKLQFSLVCMGKERADDPRQYVLDDTKIAGLGALTERFTNLQIQSANAKAELQKAQKAVQKFNGSSGNSDTVNLAAEKLETVVIEKRASDLPSELRTASANVENAHANVAGAVANLKPWNQNSTYILAQTPPTGHQAERWRDAAKRLEKEFLSLLDQRKRNDREIMQLKTKVDNLTQLEGLVTDEQADLLRRSRDRAWHTHYERLDRETADAFKAAMDEYDRVRELRSERSDRIAELRSIQIQLKEKETIRDSLDNDEENCKEEEKELLSQTAPVLASLGLPANFSPLDLPDWLEKRSRAESSIVEFQKRKKELDQKSAVLNAQRAELIAALDEAGIADFDKSASLGMLLKVAGEAASEAKNARVRLEAKERQQQAAKENLEERRSALDSIEQDLVEWEECWLDACKNSWLQGLGPESVKALLDEFRKLRVNVSKLDEMDHRISGMEQEIGNFAERVRALAADLGQGTDADPLGLFNDIETRVGDAQNAQREFEKNRNDREREEKEIQRADDELSKIEQRVSELARIFSYGESIASADDLVAELSKCEQRSAVRKEIARCEQRLMNLLKTEAANEAVALVESKRETLESEILACRAEVGSAGEEFVRRVRESAEARNRIEAVGSDEKAATLMQNRQTLLVEIRETARKALQSRLGVFAARRALQKYREAHRNELLENASNFFTRLTLGNYSKLETDGSVTEETLIARRVIDNRSCQVRELSKGTQFQLYLALRLAGFKRFCLGKSPLPFVADDIMASFDDERAEKAFRIMLEISKSSQMIYLTHHEHMLEIAEKACGRHILQHHLPSSRPAA